MQAKAEFLDRRNWIAIGWLMLKFLIGLLCLLSVVVLFVTPLLFILTPLFFHFFDIYLVGIQIDTFTKSLVIMAMGVIFAFISSRLLNVLVRLIGSYTLQMTKMLNRIQTTFQDTGKAHEVMRSGAEGYASSAYLKLGVRNREEAVLKALEVEILK